MQRTDGDEFIDADMNNSDDFKKMKRFYLQFPGEPESIAASPMSPAAPFPDFLLAYTDTEGADIAARSLLSVPVRCSGFFCCSPRKQREAAGEA